jgi:DNA repair exonuclease SbcCD ATPase subunit
MLEIQNVSWRNFMSYGEETSSLDLSELGQVLITGEIEDETQDGLKKSNGSGKSTIPNVILWALFGRTMHSANPGDAVINHFIGKDCWVKITLKNGDSITRTRGLKGHNELLYTKNGEENTLSTNKNLQQLLNKDLQLDWELFTSSAFFTQYSKSWLEMADNNRKKALERILRVDRFTFYATAAKSSAEKVDAKLSKINIKIESAKARIAKATTQIERNTQLRDNFEGSKTDRIRSIQASVDVNQQKADVIKIPDLDKITQIWEVYTRINDKIEAMKNDQNDILRKTKLVESTINDLKSKAASWKNKKGKQCLSCMQDIDESHIQQHIEPLITQQATEEATLNGLLAEKSKLTQNISATESKLAERKPKVTLREAKSIIDEKNQLLKLINRDLEHITKIENEQNPYTSSLDDLENSIIEDQTIIIDSTQEKEQQELLYRHYTYLSKAYSERNKIKSYVFKEHIPFINQRLNHYLDMLNLDIKVNLTENLGLDSNMWGYDFQSGGERKRTDVAFMLAAFDFHEAMYGRQCNVLVLDEVDGRMDDDGIDGLIDIIKQELSRKAETILIISHRNQMHDVFDKEIKVTKSNNYSKIRQM